MRVGAPTPRLRSIEIVALARPPLYPAEIVCDPEVMSGEPIVRGTRVPAHTILACLRGGMSNVDIFQDYPTLPIDGIEAVIRWADANIGAKWRTAAE
jgi:uncharacterized protein (DUF433 family)